MVVSLFFIGGKSPDIKGLKKGGCYEREKQRDKGKQEGATEKPQREEKDEEGEEEQVGLEEALGGQTKDRKGHPPTQFFLLRRTGGAKSIA